MTNNENKKDNKSEAFKREEEILQFWKQNKIFEKSMAKSSPKGEFVFYDGPPFATGLPHYGSLLSSIAKDVIPRYKTMRGYHVRRRWGWDCHGLPIENMIEKRLGLKTKKDIEMMGVGKFNETCRSAVLETAHDWKNYIERIGRWVDFDNAYMTMDNSYIESVWWALSEINKKGLLYKGRKVLMYCPRCETPLAKAEVAMDNSYKTVTEEAVIVKFKLKSGQKIGDWGADKNIYVLAWTTTPWTLPSNVALAVNPEIPYCLIEIKDVKYILAKARLEIMTDEYNILKEFKGEDLKGLTYEPLYDILTLKTSAGSESHYVVLGDFITTEDGTGVVHIAPIYGEEDYNIGLKNNLPMIPLLDQSGHFNESAPEFIKGFYFKKGEKYIKEDLENRKRIFAKNTHTHSYPHCHRCETPLYYSALSSWFINIQKVKNHLKELNEKINWFPEHLKYGRFLNNIESAPDWNISRNRYWASPLPIWKCEKCRKIELVNSMDDLKNKIKKSGNKYFVMRHGRAESNNGNLVSSKLENSHKYPLTDKGKEQVAVSAEKLAEKKIDLIFYSEFERTKKTAFIVAEKTGLSKENIISDKRLLEIDAGIFDGRSIKEYDSYFSSVLENFTKAPPEGENLDDLKKRTGEFLYELERKYSGKNILIVSHEYPIWMLYSVAKGLNEKEAVNARKDKDDFIGTGEFMELDFTPLPHNIHFMLDLHRPYIDEIDLVCGDADCGSAMKRVPEVIDGWFESSSMPFAEYHYPFENEEGLRKRFPSGDFVSEYIAQTRTWFYYMHAISAMLFDDISFKNVVTTGNILAEDGGKMSKSKGNYTDPLANLDKYGADALRYYLMTSPVMQAEDIKFMDEEIRDAYNKVINILLNTFKFFDLYQNEYDGKTKCEDSENILDKWILVKLDVLLKEVTDGLESYNTVKSGRPIKDFVNEFSTWYVRRSRNRVRREGGKDKQFALATMKHTLIELSKIIAPLMPFIAEDLYHKLNRDGFAKESVHLEDWPIASLKIKNKISNLKSEEQEQSLNEKLLEEMEEVRRIVSLGLEARAKANIKVRQPLASLKIKNKISNLKSEEQMLGLIKDELNVKKVIFDDKISSKVELDIEMTPELKEEGDLRELTRRIQDMRKNEGFNPNDVISLQIKATSKGREFLEKNMKKIMKLTSLKEVKFIEITSAGKIEVEDILSIELLK